MNVALVNGLLQVFKEELKSAWKFNYDELKLQYMDLENVYLRHRDQRGMFEILRCAKALV